MAGDAVREREAVTQLLSEATPGDSELFERLLPVVYEELHSMAAGQLRRERDGHTLNATALVHEAYLRLVDQTRIQWQSRGHFFAVASQAMRRILVNYARAQNGQKRGGKAEHVSLDEVNVFANDADAERMEELDEALRCLAENAQKKSAGSLVDHRRPVLLTLSAGGV